MPSMEDIARALGLELPSRRHATVTETLLPAEGALHPVGCRCVEDECVGRSVQLDATALPPGVARCDDDVVAARRGAR